MASGIDVQAQQQQKQESKAAGPGANRSQLVQRLLDASANLPAFVNDLIQTQAVTVAGTEACAFIIERGQDNETGLRPIAHIRPDDSAPDVRAAAIEAFKDIVKPCVQHSKDGAIEVGPVGAQSAESQFCLVTLLRNEGEVVAVSAVITRCVNADRARQRLMSMQLVAGYFELYTLRRNSEQARSVAQSHQHVLQLATSVATAEGFEAAAMGLCNELTTRSGAARVTLGWVKGRNVKVKALSHTEQFDKKQELIVQIEKAMEECLDQEQIVHFDASGQGGSDNVTRAAQALSRAQGGHTVLSLPLRRNAEIVGVVTLEFLPNQVLAPQVPQALAIAVDLLAPQLYDRYQNDRWLITKTAISAREGVKMVVGPKHTLAKIVIALVIAGGLFVTFYTWMFRVTAPFQFVPNQKYVASVPFEGIVQEIGTVNGEKVRPGMRVNKGQLLVKLETYQLEQQLNKADHQILALLREAQKARKENKQAEAMIADARRQEAEAERNLLADQIARASIVAPMDAYVLKSETEDKLNAPVKEGDVLFELGARDDLKVELTVNERDIQYLRDGRDAQGVPLPDEQKQRGQLATTSSPRDKFGFKIDRIVPLGDAKEGTNNFHVYATLDRPSAESDWRPGMMGEARIDVEKKPIIWLWTHRLVDFVRLKLWI